MFILQAQYCCFVKILPTLWFSSCININLSSSLYWNSTFECNLYNELKRELILNHDIEMSVSVFCCTVNDSMARCKVSQHMVLWEEK